MMSFGPPGGNGTISRMGLVGKSSAAARAGHNNANASEILTRILMNASLLSPAFIFLRPIFAVVAAN
jgi:hypothetical protein